MIEIAYKGKKYQDSPLGKKYQVKIGIPKYKIEPGLIFPIQMEDANQANNWTTSVKTITVNCYIGSYVHDNAYPLAAEWFALSDLTEIGGVIKPLLTAMYQGLEVLLWHSQF